MQSRRQFLGALSLPAAAAGALTTLKVDRALAVSAELTGHPGTPDEVAADQAYWYEVRRAFSAEPSIINLNSGGVSPSPIAVQEAMKRYQDYSNTSPTYAMWRILEPQREGVRERLARQWKADPEELALVRNASEALQICQFGMDLEPGDEILTTTQDYGRMLTTYKQRERREGIVMRQIQVPVPCDDPAEFVRLFEEGITDRTRVILMCHMINLTGQVLPVRDIAQMARRHDVKVIVDGAHSFAHIPFTFEELDCDYFGTSLHKWLFAPHGTGLLYVRRDKIPGLWPLMAAAESRDDNIRKYEEIGTHPAAPYLAIGDALSFNKSIGLERKITRMIWLRDYWLDRLTAHDRVYVNTPLKPGMSGGIANFGVEGIETSALNQWLWDEHRIITVAINHAEFNGLRISPSVFSSVEDLDRFCDAVEHAIEHGLPA